MVGFENGVGDFEFMPVGRYHARGLTFMLLDSCRLLVCDNELKQKKKYKFLIKCSAWTFVKLIRSSPRSERPQVGSSKFLVIFTG